MQRFRDLTPNPVLGIVNTPTSLVVARRQPVLAYEDQGLRCPTQFRCRRGPRPHQRSGGYAEAVIELGQVTGTWRRSSMGHERLIQVSQLVFPVPESPSSTRVRSVDPAAGSEMAENGGSEVGDLGLAEVAESFGAREFRLVDEPDAAPGFPLVALVGELDQYEDSYQLCYVLGPQGIIVALEEQIG
jgi:hypothetical protein